MIIAKRVNTRIVRLEEVAIIRYESNNTELATKGYKGVWESAIFTVFS